MADTLEQLRKKFEEADRKAKAAYKAIHFSDRFDTPSLEQRYNVAKKNREKNFAAIEEKYRKAQEEYGVLRREADALESQIKAAEKTAVEEKSKKATQGKVTDAYDKALAKLKEAERNIDFYGGDKAYKDAYIAAQTAFDAATKAGATVQALPAQKVPVPGAKGAESDKNKKVETPEEATATYSQFLDTLADPKNKKILTDVQKDLIKNFGWSGKADGQWSASFQSALQKVETVRLGLPTSLRSDIRNFILKPTISTKDIVTGGAGSGGPKTTTDITKSVEKMTQADIDAMINKSAESILGREITAEDKSADWYKTLNAGIKKMIDAGTTYKTVSTTNKGSSVSDRTVTPKYSPEKAGQLIESTLKTADPESLARKERVDFMSWMFSNLGGR